MKPLILILRGHIRSSFDDSNLYELVKSIYLFNNNLHIYISTWNVYSNNLSWRPIDVNNTIVTEDTIYNYFNDLKHVIKHIIIDDDTTIKLIGNIDGNVSKSKMPLKGWKNYWYNKFKIIDYLYKHNNHSEMVINCRFDVLNNSNNFDNNTIVNFINKNIHNFITSNTFMQNKEFCGIDNIYLGTISSMYDLIHIFYHNLDDILLHYNNCYSQEFLVWYIQEFINKKIYIKKIYNQKQKYLIQQKQKYSIQQIMQIIKANNSFNYVFTPLKV